MTDLKEDRAAIASLHTFSAAKPAQAPSDRWRKPAVNIAVPSNRHFASGPYSGGRMSDNLHGNRTAKATVVNQMRPNNVPRSRRQPSAKVKQKSPGLRASEAIVIDSEDSEDIGQRVSSDDLNLIRDNNQPIAGPSSSNSTDLILAHGEIESDQIQETPRIDFKSIRKGHVPSMAKKFEPKTQPPTLEFHNSSQGQSFSSQFPQPKRPKTATMKGKAGMTMPRIPPVRNQDPLSQTTEYNRSKGSTDSPDLKIKQWRLGNEVFEGEFYFAWGSLKRKITLKSLSSQFPFITLSLDEMQRITCSDHGIDHDIFVQLELGKPMPKSCTSIPPFYKEFSESGLFTILLHPIPLAHWTSLRKYLLDNVEHVEFVRGKTPNILWEMAERAQGPSGQKEASPADLPTQPRSNRKRKASSTFEKVSSKRSRSGSPPIVIDQEVSGTSHPDVVDQDALATRRTTRQSHTTQKITIPREDLDEVILVYPIGLPGAVPITNADLNRLAPGEFLNDTLIEFGLKLWLGDLQEQNPSLANDIHIFNSFFYKKLSKKNLNDGYLNVKRWTAKVDIFQKKIVIVPINENLHWYLAIIYMPEYMLQAPQETCSPNTRGKARASTTTLSSTDARAATFTPVRTKSNSPSADDDSVSGKAPSSSEVQVADELLMIEAKCSAVSAVEDAMVSSPLSTPPLSPMHIDSDDELRLKNTVSSPSGSDIVDPVTSQMELTDLADDAETIGSDSGEIQCEQSEASTRSALPETFYGNSKHRWKAKNRVSPPNPVESDVTKVDEARAQVAEIVTEKEMSGQPQTYIFILDSLGSRHPKAATTLSQYLQLEAKEKKGLDNTSKAIGRNASVPPQPNFCDCGIYLLHFAKVFAANHTRLSQLIINPPKRTSQGGERHQVWQVDELIGFRESLADRVQALSKQYKEIKDQDKKKQETESNTAVTEVESSDSEISIVDTTPAPNQKKGKRSKPAPTESMATRLR